MKALLHILPLYFLLMLYCRRDLKMFLLVTAITTLPFETTYSFIFSGQRNGWASGVQISLSEVSLVLLFVYLLAQRTQLSFDRSILTPMLLFVAACALSLVNSTAGMTTVYQLIMLTTTAFLYYFVFTNGISSDRDIRNVLEFMLIALVFQSCIAVVQYLTGDSLDFFRTGTTYRETLMTVGDAQTSYRVRGTAPHPNTFAAYLVPLLIVHISMVFAGARGKVRVAAILLGMTTLIFTYSRGGWLSFSVAMTLLVVYCVRSGLIEIGRIVPVIGVVALTVLVFFEPIHDRITGDDHNAARSRLPLITLATHMIKEHPLVGVGANTFSNVIPVYVTPDLEGQYLDQVHNQYLLVCAETGCVGFLAYLWLLFSLIRENRTCIEQNESAFHRFLGLGIAFGMTATCVHMMTDLFNSRLLLGSLFMLGGLASAAKRVYREQVQGDWVVEDAASAQPGFQR